MSEKHMSNTDVDYYKLHCTVCKKFHKVFMLAKQITQYIKHFLNSLMNY